MTKKLFISEQLSLPLDAVTNTFAILARRRVGKTYTASVIAEEMVYAGIPWVAIDPTGAWWGLRSSSNGKEEGLPVIVIGGAHGDLPLESTAGKVIADVVVDYPGWYILDLSQFESNAQQDRFTMEFGERIYRRKQKDRFPMMLFMDEADMVLPQRPQHGQERMLGAYEAIVRRGGIYGLGITLITQRPAIVNKNVLTQCETLIVLSMSAPQDQDAVDDWVKRNGTKEQRDQMMASLASLKTGKAWFWSPTWLETFQLISIRERNTFNSSATPKHGEKIITPRVMAQVDLLKLGEQIQATLEKQKENDPAQLRKQISKLEEQLRLKPANPKPQIIEQIKEVSVFKPEHIEALQKLSDKISIWTLEAGPLVSTILEIARGTQVPKKHIDSIVPLATGAYYTAYGDKAKSRSKSYSIIETTEGETYTVGEGERKILTAVIQFHEGRTKKQLRTLTGYAKSSVDTYVKFLRQKGLVVDQGGHIVATNQGIDYLPEIEELPTGQDLQQYWLNTLPIGERDILAVLLQHYPNYINKHDLVSNGEEVGLTSYAKSTIDTYLKLMRHKNLIEELSGSVRASSNLF